MKSSPLAGHAAAFVTTLIWGTTFISTKVLLRVFTPSEILLLRFAIGYFALWCAFPRPLAIKDRRQELCFLAAGLCGVTLYSGNSFKPSSTCKKLVFPTPGSPVTK